MTEKQPIPTPEVALFPIFGELSPRETEGVILYGNDNPQARELELMEEGFLVPAEGEKRLSPPPKFLQKQVSGWRVQVREGKISLFFGKALPEKAFTAVWFFTSEGGRTQADPKAYAGIFKQIPGYEVPAVIPVVKIGDRPGGVLVLPRGRQLLVDACRKSVGAFLSR